MPNTLRGAAAIVGIGELKPERERPNRDTVSLLTEACYLAIQDAGLTKSDIDGLIMEPEIQQTASGFNAVMAEHMGEVLDLFLTKVMRKERRQDEGRSEALRQAKQARRLAVQRLGR